MNSSGNIVEEYSYDPWGRRRNPTNWTFDNVPQPSLLERGFTGHEHLDKLGLINMNGRIYDPILGRFLGVDPIIQLPDNSQSFNGYSYALNNPLKYTDPTGYSRSAIDWSLQYSSVEAIFSNNYIDYWGQMQDVFANMHTYEEVEKNKDNKKEKEKGQEPEYTLIIVPGIPFPIIVPKDNVLLKTWVHYLFGMTKDLHLNTSALDFSFVSVDDLKYKPKTNTYEVNLFNLNKLSFTSLALGKVSLNYVGNNYYSINPDEYNFNIEWKNGFSDRNVGTIISGLLHGPVIDDIPLIPFSPSVITGSGSYRIIFHGLIYIKP